MRFQSTASPSVPSLDDGSQAQRQSVAQKQDHPNNHTHSFKTATGSSKNIGCIDYQMTHSILLFFSPNKNTHHLYIKQQPLDTSFSRRILPQLWPPDSSRASARPGGGPWITPLRGFGSMAFFGQIRHIAHHKASNLRGFSVSTLGFA